MNARPFTTRDSVTVEERAEIDRAVGEGRVRRFERPAAAPVPPANIPPMQPRESSGKTPRRGMALPTEMGVWDALQWAFGTECAAMDADELGASSGGQMRGMSPEAVLEQRFMLGNVTIDTSAGRSSPADDAEVIASVVRASLHWNDAVWIADLARAGRVPDAMVGEVPRLVPEEWHGNRYGWRGKASDSAELGDQGWRPIPRRNRKGVIVRDVVRYTPCHWTPTPRKIGAARRAYLDWWGHLLTVQAALRAAGLRRFRVTGEMPAMTPWRRYG